jgi:hypothetical protein
MDVPVLLLNSILPSSIKNRWQSEKNAHFRNRGNEGSSREVGELSNCPLTELVLGERQDGDILPDAYWDP